MSKQLYAILAAGLLALAMWLWVQDVAIPHQIHESTAKNTPRGVLSDIYPRWVGTRELLLRGRDPYSADVTRDIQIGYYGRPIDPSRPNDPKDEQAFAYPVYVSIFFAPTVNWSFPTVQRLFAGLFILLTATSVLWWLEAIGYHLSVTLRIAWILFTLGCFPSIQGFKLQQPTLLVAAFLARSLYEVSRRRLVWAGILLALATIKPQLAALPAAWMGIWVLGSWRERQGFLWSFAGSVGALVGFGEWLLPGWIHEFRAASVAYYHYTGGGRSVLDVLLTPGLGRVVAGMAILLCLILVWKMRGAAPDTPEFQWSLSTVMATTLVIIPMFAPYNQVLILPALMVMVRAADSLWDHSPLTRFLSSVTAVTAFWPWVSALLLVTALVLLPASLVEKAWAMPLYTSLAIPVMVWGTLIAGKQVLCGQQE
jgi:hypothetical protein